MHRPPLLPALLIAAMCLPAQPALAAPVQRCVTPEGRTVYTDRRCSDLGAADRVPSQVDHGNSLDAGPRLYRGGCPRTLSALVGEIGAAVQSTDVNRLSSVYDWAGTSDAGARRILDRLEAVVERPLLDIVPVMPAEPDEPAIAAPAPAPPVIESAASPAGPTPPPGASWQSRWTQPAVVQGAADASTLPHATTALAPAEVAPVARRPQRPRPVALRLEQTLAGTATPSRTVFGLRRSFGCFWISL